MNEWNVIYNLNGRTWEIFLKFWTRATLKKIKKKKKRHKNWGDNKVYILGECLCSTNSGRDHFSPLSTPPLLNRPHWTFVGQSCLVRECQLGRFPFAPPGTGLAVSSITSRSIGNNFWNDSRGIHSSFIRRYLAHSPFMVPFLFFFFFNLLSTIVRSLNEGGNYCLTIVACCLQLTFVYTFTIHSQTIEFFSILFFLSFLLLFFWLYHSLSL